jgi:hypothetical protein
VVHAALGAQIVLGREDEPYDQADELALALRQRITVDRRSFPLWRGHDVDPDHLG